MLGPAAVPTSTIPMLRTRILTFSEVTSNPRRFLELIVAGYDRYAAAAVLAIEEIIDVLTDGGKPAEGAPDAAELARAQAAIELYELRLGEGGYEHEGAEKAAGEALEYLARVEAQEAGAWHAGANGAAAARPGNERPKRGKRKASPTQRLAGLCHGRGRQIERRTGRKWDESVLGARDGLRHEQVLEATKGRTDYIGDLDLYELGVLLNRLEGMLHMAKRGAPQGKLSLVPEPVQPAGREQPPQGAPTLPMAA
jgi:hypothetical protein